MGSVYIIIVVCWARVRLTHVPHAPQSHPHSTSSFLIIIRHSHRSRDACNEHVNGTNRLLLVVDLYTPPGNGLDLRAALGNRQSCTYVQQNVQFHYGIRHSIYCLWGVAAV